MIIRCSPSTRRPGLGTPTAATAAVLRRRATNARRPPPVATPRRDLALGRPAHCGDHPPAGSRPRLTRPESPLRPGKKPAGLRNPAHPARQPGTQARPEAEKGHPPQSQPHRSRSRNIEARNGGSLFQAVGLALEDLLVACPTAAGLTALGTDTHRNTTRRKPHAVLARPKRITHFLPMDRQDLVSGRDENAGRVRMLPVKPSLLPPSGLRWDISQGRHAGSNE
jgi:hypothetical protein